MNPSLRSNQGRILELDGIRGLAIALVLYAHLGPDSLIPVSLHHGDWLRKTITAGATGVDLFFVLSGFLIGGILMDQRDSENYFRSFYIRRGCRILPPYLLTLAGFLIFKALLAGHSSQAWYQELLVNGGMPFWADLTLTQNYVCAATGLSSPDWINVNWTLGVEEQFYLVFPLALWLLRPSLLAKIFVVLLGLNPLAHLFLCIFNVRAFEFLTWVLPLKGDALMIGVLCAFAARQGNFPAWFARNRRRMGALFLFLLVGTVGILTQYDKATLEYERILFFNLWIALFYAGLLLLAVNYQSGFVARAMRFPPLCKLGAISYSVYLFHMPIDGLLHGLLLGRDRRCREPVDAAVTVAAIMVTLIFCTVLLRVLEKPMIAWGHSFSYGRPKNRGDQ